MSVVCSWLAVGSVRPIGGAIEKINENAVALSAESWAKAKRVEGILNAVAA